MYTVRIYSPTGFEWDPAKRRANLRKHGVDFVGAVRVFEGPVLEERRFASFPLARRIDMRKGRTVKYNPRKHRDRTDWKRVRKLADEDIERAVASDPDAAPIMDQAWWSAARVVLPMPKVPVSVRLDRDVLDWFKRQGPRYQSRINAVLRAFMEAHRRAG